MPGLVSSSARLIVIWFLSCALRLSGAEIWPNEVLEVLYRRLDSNVTLACGKFPGVGAPVAWRLNQSSELPWHQMTSEGSLVLFHVNHTAQGDYSCYDDQGLLLHSVRLKLGHPPGLLSISCQVPNHTHVRCSWVDSVKTFLPAKYNASIRGSGQDWRPCVVDLTNKHCEVDHPAFWQTIHTVRIIETNGLGSFTTLARFKLDELLKPNPPRSVVVTEVRGFPKRLKVSWSYPSSWPQYAGFPLLFHIRYRPLHALHWSEVYWEHSPYVISDALAGHFHQVQVRARDEVNSDSQWSEWSPLQDVQPWKDAVPEPTEENPADYSLPSFTNPETSTEKSHNPDPDEVAELGLVILLVVFSVVIIAIFIPLIFLIWMKQRRQSQGGKHELTSMVKMKAMPI
ncbi:interleukin-11 receptor subunit alpha isoform 1-T2 [Synchiropus picturatus]